MEEMGLNLQDMFGQLSPRKQKNKSQSIGGAGNPVDEALQEMIDMDLAPAP